MREFFFPNNLRLLEFKQAWLQYFIIIGLGVLPHIVLYSYSLWFEIDVVKRVVSAMGFQWAHKPNEVTWHPQSFGQFANLVLNNIIHPFIEAVCVFVGLLAYGVSRAFSDLKQISISRFGKFLISGALVILSALIIRHYVWKTTGYVPSSINFDSQMNWMTIFATMVIGPISEEFFVRFGLYRLFRTKFSFLPSALISAIIFGAMHLGNESFIIIPISAILGFVFAWFYEQTNTILAPMALHMIMNSSNELAYLCIK